MKRNGGILIARSIHKRKKERKITKQFLHHISAFIRQILSFFEKTKKKKTGKFLDLLFSVN